MLDDDEDEDEDEDKDEDKDVCLWRALLLVTFFEYLCFEPLALPCFLVLILISMTVGCDVCLTLPCFLVLILDFDDCRPLAVMV